MNRTGQIETAVGLIFIVGLIIVGSITSVNVLSEHRFIGDNSSKEYFDLSKCVVKIPAENYVQFSNAEEAIKEGFKSASCNG